MKASRWADAETKFTDRELAAIRSLERPHQVVTMNETEIPLQARYETDKPYVPSDLADIPCSKLGADRLLDCLNDVLKSSYTIHTHRVSETLQVFIDSGYDFGTAYGYSRHHSNLTNGSLSSKSFLHYKEHNAQSSRERFLSEDDYHIRLPFAPPVVYGTCTATVSSLCGSVFIGFFLCLPIAWETGCASRIYLPAQSAENLGTHIRNIAQLDG